MKTTLFVRLAVAMSTPADWLLADAEGQVLESGQLDFQQSEVALPSYQHCVVFLPSIYFNLRLIPDMPLNGAQLYQAIAYALEGQVIDDIADIHFAYLRIVKSNQLLVAMVERSYMQACLDQLAKCHIIPDYMQPDALVMPYEQEQLTLFILQDLVAIKSDQYMACMLDRVNLNLFVQKIYQDAPYKKLSIYSETKFSETELKFEPDSPLQIEQTQQSWLPYLAQHWPQAPKMNLLQEEFGILTGVQRQKRAWKWLAGAVCAWVLVNTSINITAIIFYRYHQNLLQQRITRLYKQVFPQASSVVAPRFRIQNKLEQLSNHLANDQFQQLLAKIALVLKTNRRVTLSKLTYNNQKFILNLVAPSSSVLDDIQQLLQDKKLTVQRNQLIRQQQTVKATLTVGIQ